MPDATALAAEVERVRAAALSLEDTGKGFLVRDPSRNAVLLTADAAR
jgi:hypothetical protein